MRDEKLSLESSSTLYVTVVCVCIYKVYLTHRERENARDVLRVRVFKVQMHYYYPKEQKEQKEQKEKSKKTLNFLFKRSTLHKKRTRTKNFIQTLLLVFYSTKNKDDDDDVLERLRREIQREEFTGRF